MKWIAPTLAYLAIGIGLFVFHSAWGALLGFHFAILISLSIARPDIPIALLFKSTNVMWTLVSLLLCGSSGITLYYAWGVFRFAPDFSAQVATWGLNKHNWIPFITYFSLVNPFMEEYFWRGYLGSDVKTLHSTDLIFAGYHIMLLINKLHVLTIIYAVGLLIAASWLWRQVKCEDQGLLAAVIGHMAADLTILLAVYLHI